MVQVVSDCCVVWRRVRLGARARGAPGSDALADYLASQGARGMAIGQAQAKVVVRTEIEYRDRIEKIYLKGEVIEKQVPAYVTAADNAECQH